MLPENDIKEELSIAFVHAIVGNAGYFFDPPRKDFGVDTVIRDVIKRGKRYRSGYNIEIQLKATSDFTEDTNSIKYSLENKNYNDLLQDRLSPLFLVVLCLPTDRSQWLIKDIDQLILKKCAFWLYNKDLPAKSNEKSKTVITIPKSQVFSKDLLDNVFTILKKEGRFDGFH